uniref:Uncharacterized protein n=1 Tax=Romanomermis culicivorax TaxID=13658 RepID=A0A915HLC5_ROMCU
MVIEGKNWRHQRKIESKNTKVGNAMKNAVKNQCLKKRGKREIMKNPNSAQQKCEKREKFQERKHEGDKGPKEHRDSRKFPAASLDRARNNERTQHGAPMSDTNSMIQAQQQMSYLPPNYPGLPMVNCWQVQQCLGLLNSKWPNFQ